MTKGADGEVRDGLESTEPGRKQKGFVHRHRYRAHAVAIIHWMVKFASASRSWISSLVWAGGAEQQRESVRLVLVG